MDLDSKLCDGTVVTSLPETRNSMRPPPHHQPRRPRRTAANKPASSNGFPSTSNPMSSSSPHCVGRGGVGGAASGANSYSNSNSTWRKPSIPEGRRISTMQQQQPKRMMSKQQYHRQQQQQHERRLGVSQATAAAAAATATADYAASASPVASETTTRASGTSETSSKSDTPSTSATSPPERECDRMQRELPSAMKGLEEMGVHLQSMAQQQRMMVDDTLNQWTRLGNQAVGRV
ncbi:hypothetical protein PG993_010212 [Apiospora rasikravindrae]|uniref:Uncharacterized protein n=1 Tax=Apiospora rasikravindrae TaxID=990691 RepID=A0ABR1SLM9_9PEZI